MTRLAFALLVLAACNLDSTKPAAADAPPDVTEPPPDGMDPPPPPPPDKPVRVAMGHGTACAVMESKKVRCWGANDFGQLGVPPSATTTMCSAFGRSAPCNPTPTEVPGLTEVASVDVGMFHACAVKTDASVVCWGRNQSGQLGHDPTGDETCGGQKCSPTPQVVAGLAGVADVVVSADHSCARTTAGAVRCWGENSNGTLGNGVTGAASFTPVTALGFASGATRLSTAGFSHTTCAIKNAEVFCWGLSFPQGNLGTPPTGAPQATPTKVDGVANATDIAAGERMVCALVAGGNVTCWGSNLFGQLGISPAEPSRFTPKVVPGLTNIVQLSGSMATTCARTPADNVLCWGLSEGGAIGNNSFAGDACQLAPCKATPVSASVANVEQLSMGTSGIELGQSNVVRAWGNNGFGELGHAPGTAGDVTCGSGDCNATPSVVTFPP